MNIGLVCVLLVFVGETLSPIFFKINCGVRQGGVLSAYFFAMYIDDIIKIVQRSKIGCCIGAIFVNIFLYADDIVLLAPSIDALQTLLTLCEHHLAHLDMALNAKKSICIRFGRHFKSECRSITTLSGECLCWVNSCRYLGVTLIAAKLQNISKFPLAIIKSLFINHSIPFTIKLAVVHLKMLLLNLLSQNVCQCLPMVLMLVLC